MVATAKAYQIVQYDLVKVELDLFPVADDDDALGSEQGELIDHAFRSNRLDDTDGGIQEHHAQKREVLKGPGDKNQNGQNKVNEVEERAEVLYEQLFDGFGFKIGVEIDLALGNALFHLGGRKAAKLCGVSLRHLLRLRIEQRGVERGARHTPSND